MATPDHDRFRAYLEREIAQQLRVKHGLEAILKRVRTEVFRGPDLERLIRRNSRRRPPGMAAAPVEPPRGPLPLQGGAEAPLEFRED